MIGQSQADQDTSFQAMEQSAEAVCRRRSARIRPSTGVIAFTGGQMAAASNTGRMFVTLKPLEEREGRAPIEVIAPAARQAGQDSRRHARSCRPCRTCASAARASSAQYQFTLQGDNLDDLNVWGPKLLREMRKLAGLVDVNSDQQNRGLASGADHRPRRRPRGLGISPQAIDDTLYDAFGQRQVSTMYMPLNQYHVVMEVEPRFLAKSRRAASTSTFAGSNGAADSAQRDCPAIDADTTPLAVNHSGLFPSVTISFNLAPGTSLGEAVDRDRRGCSTSWACRQRIHGSFSGNGPGLSGLAEQRAAADSGGAGHGVHRAGHSLRELHPSDHDSLDAALGRRRRAAGADALPDRTERDGADRHHSADRHREEERDHDDRLCPGGRTQRGQVARKRRSSKPASCASARSP